MGDGHQPDRRRSAGERIAGPADALARAIADRVTDLVVQALDVNALLGKVDPNSLLERVDVDALLDRVDVDALLDRVDVNRLLNRADVDKIARRIDVDAVLAGVDVDGLLARVDVNKAIQRIDVEGLVEHTDLGPIIARSSGGVASEALDVVRSQAVGLDEFTGRLVARLRRRSYPGPPGPPQSGDVAHPDASPDGAPPPVTEARLQGHYAGAASRLAAYMVDAAVSSGVFMLALAALSYAVSIVTGHAIAWGKSDLIAGIFYLAWEFAYYAYSWAASGRTPGMTLLGVRVVRPDGGALRPSQAIVRTLVFPVSFLILGLGFAGILIQRRRQAWHDLAAGTVVSYDWDARAARFRFLARHQDEATERPAATTSD
ncbi:MAG TPA: RDD family protein [Streptosporangiaceae bacterium]